jgi:hypothetical protein
VFCPPKGFQNTFLGYWQLKTEVLQLPLYSPAPRMPRSVNKCAVKKVSHKVPAVYDVFAVAIKETVGFQQPQKCGGEKPHKGA